MRGIVNSKFLQAVLLMAVPFGAGPASATPADSNGEPILPWAVSTGATIDKQDLTFDNRGARLSGTLSVPHGAEHAPAIVVLHGASSASRSLPLYRHLMEMLTPLGIAVFVFDRRGSGASTGGANDSENFDILADDGVAAARMLAGTPRIDGKRVGYWGISQGGWLTLLAAAKDPQAAFAIAVSAPMTTPDVQMNFAVANILRIDGYPQTAIDEALGARRAEDDYLRGTLAKAAAQSALDKASAQPWFHLAYLDRDLPAPQTSTWLDQMRFDPLPILDRVRAPTLLIYGQADPWVPVGMSLQKLAAAHHPNVETVVIDGADHTMMLNVPPKDQIDQSYFPKEAPDAPAYFAALSAWLVHHGLAHLPAH